MQFSFMDINDSLKQNFSPQLLQALIEVQQRLGGELYLVGGTVRDWILGRKCGDLDVAVQRGARKWAEGLAQKLGRAAIVDLSGPEDETFRVVWNKEQLDISSFRGGVTTIRDDLQLRDFSINSLALDFMEQTGGQKEKIVIDPTGGLEDLENGKIRHLPGAFVADPIRMLRGYRLVSQFGFSLTTSTRESVRLHRDLIYRVAVERVGAELKHIFDSSRTSEVLSLIDEDGLLQLLLPELYSGEGVSQPQFHHLDVLQHSFQALRMVEQILEVPEKYFPKQWEVVAKYLRPQQTRRCLKWAALLHDIGKPSTKQVGTAKNSRVTFYRHDEAGKALFIKYAERSHWSGEEIDRVSSLIGMHMHPFHLCNVVREKSSISKRAALKLSRRAGDELIGLFLLAMADSLASKGEKKPPKMEEELVLLFADVQEIFVNDIEPVLQGPPLITGKDLIELFGLEPSPLFGLILKEFEEARVEGAIEGKEDGIDWVKGYLEKRGIRGSNDAATAQ